MGRQYYRMGRREDWISEREIPGKSLNPFRRRAHFSDARIPRSDARISLRQTPGIVEAGKWRVFIRVGSFKLLLVPVGRYTFFPPFLETDMRKAIFGCMVAVLFVGAGCQDMNGNNKMNRSGDPKMMSADVCPHCAGVQTGTADGKCEKCGMAVKK